MSTKFEIELNNISKNLMHTNEIQKLITDILIVKFNEFEKRVYYPYWQNILNNYDNEISDTNKGNTDINSRYNNIIEI